MLFGGDVGSAGWPGAAVASDRGENLFGRSHLPDARKDLFHSMAMALDRTGSHCVFREYLVVTVLIRNARGAFHANVGCDAAEDNGMDAPAAELQVKFRAVERAPLSLCNYEVGFQRFHLRQNLTPVRRHCATRGNALVDSRMKAVFHVSRRCYAHEEYRHSVVPKPFPQLCGIP